MTKTAKIINKKKDGFNCLFCLTKWRINTYNIFKQLERFICNSEGKNENV